MGSDDLAQVRGLLSQAGDLPPDQRDVFLAQACGDDSALRKEVQSLLAMLEQADKFLEPVPTAKPQTATGLLDDSTEREPFSAPDLHAPGSTISHYRILQLLGEGGFGRVYLAEQEQPVRRQVALKVIKPGMDTSQVIRRFKSERQALAMMDHPNIAKVLDAGSTDSGRPYFVMELVRGMPLTEYCDAVNLGVRERLKLFTSICGAVQHAHQKGIIHRDIKPSNVLVTLVDGVPVPKVIDFGVAKAIRPSDSDSRAVTEIRQWMGTPQYMSPEQAGLGGGDIDTRSDVYSLGVLLYELLTGSTPFDSCDLRGSSPEEAQRIIREVEPRRPSVTAGSRECDNDNAAVHRGVDARRRLSHTIKGDLDWIVMRCLEKDRTRRYETASGLARDIEHHLNGDPVSAGPPSRIYRVRKFVRRHKPLIAAVTLVLLASILGTIGTTIGLLRAIRERDSVARSETKATKEGAKAAALNTFLLHMLGSADPQLAKGKDVLVRDILDQASQEVKANPPTDIETHEAIEHTLGGAYQALGLYGLAAEHLRQSLDLRSQRYGSTSLEAARVMGELADSLWEDLQYAPAVPYYRQSLQIRRTMLGNENAEVAAITERFANMLQGQGDYRGAYASYNQALAIRRKLFGEESLDTAESLLGLAVLYRDDGKWQPAREVAGEALRIRRKLLGDKDLRVADALIVLASVSGPTPESMTAFQDALAIQKQMLGPDHPRVAVTLMLVAQKFEERNNFGSEPEAVLRDALRIKRLAYGERHGEVGRALLRIGELYLARKDWPQARQTLRQSLEVLRETLTEDGPEVGWAIRDLVPVYLAGGEFAEAEQMLLPRYQWSMRQTESRFSQEVIQMLVDVYRAWSKPDAAARWSSALTKPTTQPN